MHLHSIPKKSSRFPPGYFPWTSPYVYPVPDSTVELTCGSFVIELRQNQTQVSAVIQQVRNRYGNPQQANRQVYDGRDESYQFEVGDPDSVATTIHVDLQHVASSDLGALTYGILIHAVDGVDYIRSTYPELDFYCSIFDGGPARRFDHGVITLITHYHEVVASA